MTLAAWDWNLIWGGWDGRPQGWVESAVRVWGSYSSGLELCFFCMCVQTCMGVYVSVCTRVWRSKVGIMCLSLSPLLFFLYVKANLSPCFCLPHVGITRVTTFTPYSRACWASELQSSLSGQVNFTCCGVTSNLETDFLVRMHKLLTVK